MGDRPGGGERPATDVAHLDMDGFFAAVEVLDRPELAGRPVVVGGTSDRGVVASASYEARAYGVRSAMPTAGARRCCPGAVFLLPRHDRYAEMNRRLLALIDEVTPDFEPVALDEAYLDLRGAHRLFGDSRAIAERLRAKVRRELGLRCSIGVGRSKLVAKLASRAAKPRALLAGSPPRPVVEPGPGIVVVTGDAERAFLAGHALRALPGVGPKTEQRLRSLGIVTVADATVIGRERLCSLLGDRQGALIADAAGGVDHRRVETRRDARSIGRETTFERDLFDPGELGRRVVALAETAARRARERGHLARTVTLKVRFSDHETITRSVTAARPPASSAIATIAAGLLAEVDCAPGVRLLGVHLSNFAAAGADEHQLALFDGHDGATAGAPDGVRAGLDEAADAIRDRFGSDSLRRLERAAQPRPRP